MTVKTKQEVPKIKFKSLLVVTYGRSGSTLLQGVLNSIDGVVVRGENFDFCWGLYRAWTSLRQAQKRFSEIGKNATSAWYGADRFDPEQFLIGARKLVFDQITPQTSATCIGFKEIRYLNHLPYLIDYLNFLNQLFPDPAFVFNTRAHDAVINSAFQKKEEPAALKQRLRQADDLFFTFTGQNQNAFIMRYETLIKGEVGLSPLFDFLGARIDKKRLKHVLDTPHSFVPKVTTVEKARDTRQKGHSKNKNNGKNYMITRGLCLDEKSPLKELTGPVIVAAIVRDEATMLPWFLKYYRSLGCKSFLIIENGSKDQSVAFLRKQKDVLLYRAPTKDYVESRSGRFWVNTLTRKYALNKWVLCVDTDELLSWPEQDSEKLGGLVKRAERLGLRRVFTPMIDAYADKPTDQLAEYLPGTPFGEICQWVDPPETSKFFWKKGRLVVFGGPRNRFVQPGEKPPITTKQSLYRAEIDGYMHDGSHFDTFLVPSPLVIPLYTTNLCQISEIAMMLG